MTLPAPASRSDHRWPLVYLTRAELDRLREYSTTLPTGTTPGKRWKCRRGGRWWLGAYYTTPELEAGERMGIAWFEVVVVDTALARSAWLDQWAGEGRPDSGGVRK